MASAREYTPICIFCYKTCYTFSLEGTKDENPQLNGTDILAERFFTHLERFRGELDRKKWRADNKNNFSNTLSCCQDCLAILDTFCSEYHQLKCMELQLEWKLQRLAGIMKLAGRVPARLVKLKEMFESHDSNTDKHHVQTSVEEKASHTRMAGFKKFRQRIIKFCAGHPLKSQPRIWLKRADNYRNTPTLSDKLPEVLNGSLCSEIFETSTAVKEHATGDVNSISLPILDVVLGWIMSFAAVVILLTFNSRQDSFTKREIPLNLDVDFGEEDLVEDVSLANPESRDNLENSNFSPSSPTGMKVVAPDNHLEESNTNNPRPVADADPTTHIKDSAGEDVATNRVENLAADFVCSDGGDSDSFEMEIKTDEPEVQEEAISDIKCESGLVSKDEPTSSDSSMSDGEWKARTKRENVKLSSLTETSSSGTMCSICNKSFASENIMKQHITRAHGPPAVSKICSKTFRSEDLMDRHHSSVKKERIHQCSECGKTFKSKDNLKRHFKIHMGPDAWDFKCCFCEKKFYTKQHLDKHLVTHNKNWKGIHDNLIEERDTTNFRHGADPDRSIHAQDSTGEEAAIILVQSVPVNSEYKDADENDSFEIETKTDEPEEQEEEISSVKCESTVVSKYEPQTQNYNFRKNRKRVYNKMEEDEDSEEGVISDNDAISCPSDTNRSSKDSSMLDGEHSIQLKNKQPVAEMATISDAKTEGSWSGSGFVSRATTTTASPVLEGSSIPEKDKISQCPKCEKKFIPSKLKFHIERVHCPRSYPCTECDKSFKVKTQLKRHELMHKYQSTWKYQCVPCGEKFRSQFNLEEHVGTAHESETPGLCTICNKAFISEDKLKQHVSVVHVERRHQCPECDKSFNRKDKLKLHLQIHLGPDAWEYTCTTCAKKFYTKQNLNKHLVTHNKDRKLFPCQFCNKTFSGNSELSSHIRLDHIDKGNVGNNEIVKCSQCSKTFIGRSRLNVHLKHAHGETTFSCLECGKSFRTKYKLNFHSLIHKGPSSWKFQCSTCGYMCYTKDNLNKHILTHDKPEAFNCQFCDFTNQNPQLLSVHVRTEHIDKDDLGDVNLIKCSQCDKKFIEQHALYMHVRFVHSEPSHQCSECGKVYKSSSQLAKHLKTHNAPGTGKFRCTKCDYTCHQQYKLKLHMIAHEKGTRINCPLCSSHFTCSRALAFHIRTEHIDKGDVGKYTVFSCSKCDSKYISKASMKRHMGRVHIARLHKCSKCDKSFATKDKLQIHCAIHQDPSTWSFPCSECGKRFYQKGAMEKHAMIYHKRK